MLAPLVPAFADERTLNPGRGDGGYLRSRRGTRVPVRTRYAAGAARFEHEVAIDQSGRLFRCADGRRVDSQGMYAGLRQWDRERPVHRGLYAMDRHGDLFFGDPSALSPDATRWIHRRPGEPLPDAVSLWHHSSFVGGEPVICAGDLRVRDGLLLAASSWSGHYRPRPEHLAAMLAELRDRGADLSAAVAEVVVDGKIRAFRALDLASGGGEDITGAWHRAQAIELAEEVTGRRFRPEDLDAFDARVAAMPADGFDADAQVHWNWLARWTLEDCQPAPETNAKDPRCGRSNFGRTTRVEVATSSSCSRTVSR
jgi:hypothetical protein